MDSHTVSPKITFLRAEVFDSDLNNAPTLEHISIQTQKLLELERSTLQQQNRIDSNNKCTSIDLFIIIKILLIILRFKYHHSTNSAGSQKISHS